MKSKLSLALGMIWASPITLVCFVFYVLPCWAMKWYEYIGYHDIVWAWKIREEAPEWMHKLWKGWAGHCVGNIVVVIERPEKSQYAGVIMTHEQQHAVQCMRLGVFQPIMYFLNKLVIRYACKNSHPYFDNPFEIDARRGAGQVIDYKKR